MRTVTDADDMHEHRRNNDTDDHHSRRLQAVAESATAKFFARVVTPALLSVTLGMGAWIGTRLLTQLDEQGRVIQSVKSDMRDLNTRMTEGVIRQVNSHSSSIDDIEKRLQVVERSVPTP